MIVFRDIEGIYKALIQDKAALVVYAIIAVIIFIVACLKVAFNTYKESQSGFTFKSVIEISKPILPAYLSFTLIPAITAAIIFSISAIFSSFTDSDIGNGDNELEQYIENSKQSYDAKIAYLDKKNKYVNIEGLVVRHRKWVEINLLEFISELNRYLFTFAVSGYFLWLILLNVFAPFGAVGFIYKEFRTYSDTWIKNFLACHAFLAAIIIANSLSLGIYNLYATVGDYNIIVHILFLIMLRGVLYSKALGFAKSII